MTHVITLDDTAYAYAKDIARRRLERVKKDSLPVIVGWDKAPEYGLCGVMGEVAACVAYGVSYEEHVRADGLDGGTDIVVNNETYSVKTTTERSYNLLVPYTQEVKTDRIVLVWPTSDPRSWELVATCTRAWWEKHRSPHGGVERPAQVAYWRQMEPVVLEGS